MRISAIVLLSSLLLPGIVASSRVPSDSVSEPQVLAQDERTDAEDHTPGDARRDLTLLTSQLAQEDPDPDATTTESKPNTDDGRGSGRVNNI